METTYLNDHFIIAMPDLADPNFGNTVTYICEHDENGSFGIVINRETDITLLEVMQQMQIEPENNFAAKPGRISWRTGTTGPRLCAASPSRPLGFHP